MLALRHRKE
jgi:hypothetical protein